MRSRIRTCTGPAHDKAQITPATDPFGELATGGAQAILAPGQLPVYPPQPHCNKLGLTELGAYFIRDLIKRDMIVEVDHMSVHAREQALTLLPIRPPCSLPPRTTTSSAGRQCCFSTKGALPSTSNAERRRWRLSIEPVGRALNPLPDAEGPRCWSLGIAWKGAASDRCQHPPRAMIV
jgi:hypothetical protein